MATKKFKKLPKDSQRAAFAQMDEDGTRQKGNGKGGGVGVKALKRQSEGLVAVRLKGADKHTANGILYRSLDEYNVASPADKAKLRKVVSDKRKEVKGLGIAGEFKTSLNAANRFLSATKKRK
jgi:hypothetical protein